MTYGDIRKKAGKNIKQNIENYRPAYGLYVDGMDDCEQIPNAIVCWLKNGDMVIYIVKEKEHDGE